MTDTQPRWRVRVRTPDGDTLWLAYAYNGFTADPSEAVGFISEAVAHRAAHAARWGASDAFWDSERRAAQATAERMKGYILTVEPVAESE